MKFYRSTSLLWTVTILLAALLANPAYADDMDLPPPGGPSEEVPFDPPPQEETEEAFPEPTLGEEDSLPEPNVGGGSPENQVNPADDRDDIFLPSPTAQDGVNYAPLAAPLSNRSIPDSSWESGMDRRPIFSLNGGYGVYSYPSEAVATNRSGPTVGASIRLLNIAQTVFLHAYGAYTWVQLGGVGPYQDVKDTVQHLGAMIEVGVGRRISLFGTLLRRNHTLKSGPDDSGAFGNIDRFTDLTNDGWKLGVGFQYDFYVIPHGSLGVRGQIEQDVGTFLLTMALEPQPKKRLSLNFQDVE